MTLPKHYRLKDFFHDKNGRVVLWQTPSFPLIAWLGLKVLSIPLADGTIKVGLSHVSTAFLFIWAYLELTQGVNHFRRLLGLIIGLGIIKSFFS
jgi:hypothetical protein